MHADQPRQTVGHDGAKRLKPGKPACESRRPVAPECSALPRRPRAHRMCAVVCLVSTTLERRSCFVVEASCSGVAD
jgi:hypothetical protein